MAWTSDQGMLMLIFQLWLSCQLLFAGWFRAAMAQPPTLARWRSWQAHQLRTLTRTELLRRWTRSSRRRRSSATQTWPVWTIGEERSRQET